MPDFAAVVRVDIQKGAFEVSGSEEFVERMLESIPSLLSTEPSGDEQNVDEGSDPTGRSPEDFGAFIERKKIVKGTSLERTTTAFIYFLTKIKRASSCTTDEIVHCYEEAGLPVPTNLTTILANLKNRSKYVKSPTRGSYALTVPGQNIVTQKMGGEV
jgi:hypothetical protein